MRIHKEGRVIVAGTALFLLLVVLFAYLATGSVVLTVITTVVALVLGMLTAHFFRDPIRPYIGDADGVVVAPADGTVVAIERTYEPEVLKRECIQVSVFMTVLNIHVNWVPAHGRVLHSEHIPGNFHAAYLPKSSIENEHHNTLIETPDGAQIVVKQVAGAIARRVVNYAAVGDELLVGQHLGFIKFGSRVDLFLPLESEIVVKLGDTVMGNETLMARLK